MAIGATFAAMSAIQPRVMRRAYNAEVAALAELDATLRSLQGRFIAAPTRADSNALAAEITQRGIFLEERRFHLPDKRRAIDGWWRRRGTGTIVLFTGIVLFCAGGVLTLRN